jgi:hydroxymethylpyrimidine pyrophosphatase-like HAD family hydrolase
MEQKYRLIAMDLYGTLNNDEKVITPATRHILHKVQQQGILLSLAAARPSPGPGVITGMNRPGRAAKCVLKC